MTTPSAVKKIWKNIDWTNQEEKLAFFNKYFKNDKIVADVVANKLKLYKDDLLSFIQEGKVKDKDNKERDITIQDIIDEVKK